MLYCIAMIPEYNIGFLRASHKTLLPRLAKSWQAHYPKDRYDVCVQRGGHLWRFFLASFQVYFVDHGKHGVYQVLNDQQIRDCLYDDWVNYREEHGLYDPVNDNATNGSGSETDILLDAEALYAAATILARFVLDNHHQIMYLINIDQATKVKTQERVGLTHWLNRERRGT